MEAKKMRRFKSGDVVWILGDKSQFWPGIVAASEAVVDDENFVNVYRIDDDEEVCLNYEKKPIQEVVLCVIEPSQIEVKSGLLKAALLEAEDSATMAQTRVMIVADFEQQKEAKLVQKEVKVVLERVQELAIQKEAKVVLERVGELAIQKEAKVVLERVQLPEEIVANVDEDVLQKCRQDNQTFLQDLDADEDLDLDDDNKENDSDWDKTKKLDKVWKPQIRQPLGPKKQQQPPMMMKKKVEVEQLSDYEKVRLKNIEQQRSMFLEAMKVMSMSMKQPQQQQPMMKKNYGRRSLKPFKTYGTRLSSRRNSTGSSPVGSEMSTPTKRGLSSDDEEEYYEMKAKRPRYRHRDPSHWIVNPNENIVQPEDVTPGMLAGVADYVSNKVYSPANGVTCHQCRQKTLDTKTICRSGRCAGIRGAFCGICLKNRYGQDAREALLNPDWWCPPCMDVCNCSICRNRMGKGATGPLTYLAQAKGYDSVRHYLEALVTARGSDEFDEDS